jgi:hypothetical protein
VPLVSVIFKHSLSINHYGRSTRKQGNDSCLLPREGYPVKGLYPKLP